MRNPDLLRTVGRLLVEDALAFQRIARRSEPPSIEFLNEGTRRKRLAAELFELAKLHDLSSALEKSAKGQKDAMKNWIPRQGKDAY